MGEASRRQRFFRLVEEQAFGAVVPGGKYCFALLGVGSDPGSVRDGLISRFGELPTLLDERLKEYAGMSMPTGFGGVLWIRWPSGRQAVCGVQPGAFENALGRLGEQAAVRGYPLRVAVDSGATPQVDFVRGLVVEHQKFVTEQQQLIEAAPALRLKTGFVGTPISAIVIPKAATAEHVAGQIGQFCRLVDGLSDSPSLLRKNAQTVMLEFEGYDDDPREVFEIPFCTGLLRTVSVMAPAWLPLSFPSNLLTWFASFTDWTLEKDGPKIALRFEDEGELQKVIRNSVQAATMEIGFGCRASDYQQLQSGVFEGMADAVSAFVTSRAHHSEELNEALREASKEAWNDMNKLKHQADWAEVLKQRKRPK